jgi:hypothetical protein
MAISDKISWDMLRRIGAANPVFKWVVIAIVVLGAVEFLGERAVKVMTQVGTMQTTIDATNEENRGKAVVARPIAGQARHLETWTSPPLDAETGLTLQGCPAGQRRMAGVCMTQEEFAKQR